MKITFFLHRYWPHVGGVEKYIHELAKALQAMGHKACVVAGATEEGPAETGTHEGIAFYRFPALRSPLRTRWWLWRYRDLFSEADVVHVSNTHMLEYYWRMIGFLLGQPNVFLTRHGMSYIHPVPESEKRRAVRSLRLAGGVVHDGAFIEKWLGVAPDLCPDQGLNPTADEVTHVPEPPPTSAAYIGRLEPDSGIPIYIDAVRRLTRTHGRPFALHVYGDGSLRPALSQIAARERLPVHFHGPTPDAQRHLTETCFALIDGRMAMQEAMARRRLVLAGYVDPLKRDYVGAESFSPFLIACGDGAELARRVLHYSDHPDQRAALVSRAFEYARTLTWQRTAQAYLTFWRDRLAESRFTMRRLQAVRLARRSAFEARTVRSGPRRIIVKSLTPSTSPPQKPS